MGAQVFPRHASCAEVLTVSAPKAWPWGASMMKLGLFVPTTFARPFDVLLADDRRVAVGRPFRRLGACGLAAGDRIAGWKRHVGGLIGLLLFGLAFLGHAIASS